MSSIEQLELLRRENKRLIDEINELEYEHGYLERDYSEVCKEHSDAILRAAQAEKYAESLRQDLADSQRNFEYVDGQLTDVLGDVDKLSRQVLGHEYEGMNPFDELSRSFDDIDEDVVNSHREIKLLEGVLEAMTEELRETTEEKRLLHKEIARLNEELSVAIGVKDDDYSEDYRKMTVEFAKEHREVRELRGLLSDIHRLSDIEV